jgi:hypothetical protein
MSEASFWDYLRKKVLPKEGHYSRIEAETAHGFPDVAYTLNGRSGTIELKDAKRFGAKHPFKGESGLRRSQIMWIRDEIIAGGKVVLALQCGEKVFLLKADYYYDAFSKMTLEDVERVSVVWWGKRAFSHAKSVREFLME